MVQQEHVHQVDCKLGKGVLRLLDMTVRESLGQPFEIVAELIDSKQQTGTPEVYDLVGETMGISIVRGGAYPKRFFHGIITEFVYLGMTDLGVPAYRATLRPWLSLLKRTFDCQIYQNKSIPDIIKHVFRDQNGFTDFEDQLKDTKRYKPWEYCVQYRESDFDFVSRLMEQEGIYYFFKHTEQKHTLVLCDSPASHQPIEGAQEIEFHPPEEGTVNIEHIFRWEPSKVLQATDYEVGAYDYEAPTADIKGKSNTSRKHPHADLKMYDYMDTYTKKDAGDGYAKVRLEELQAQHEIFVGEGDSRGFATGGKFKLTKFAPQDNKEYLIVDTKIQITSVEETPFSMSDENGFDVSMRAILSDTVYRPPRLLTKPTIAGPQSATVCGKEGEDIWTDKYGRILVKFPWDRRPESGDDGAKDETRTCWIRVAHPWAGSNWGHIFIPRIGQEVLVQFEEGDPDRPIVTGCVYNANNMPPYALSDNQTQSGIKTRTTKEGTPENFNELRFEDKKDAEEIYFHAEKDFNRVVENNDTLKVGFDKKDKGDQTIEIHNNQTLTVGNSEADDGSQTITIWKDRTETVKEGNEKVTIEKGNRDVIVSKGNDTHNVETGNRTVGVSKGDDSLSVAKGKRTVEINGNDSLTVKTGNHTIKVSAGSSKLEAATSIELKCGGSSIKLTPSGITIKSTMVKIEGSGMVAVKGGSTSIKGNIIVEVKGAMVKIN